jgi:hypothetical protein
MPQVTKLYNRLHLLRLRSAVDDYVLAEQAGFRPGRSTREQFMGTNYDVRSSLVYTV